ncbi:kinase-like protein [Cubamyces lactineus]|nr:kinase-like protein [Cubamyces lactineus]
MPRVRKRRLRLASGLDFTSATSEDHTVDPIDQALQDNSPMTTIGRHPPPSRKLISPKPPVSGPAGSILVAYRARNTDVIMERYRVQAGIGYGMFGTVVRAEDMVTGTPVAVKLLHKCEDLHDDVLRESRIFQKLLDGCDRRVSSFVRVIRNGSFDGFHCIVLDLCQATLYDIVKGYCGLIPLPARHVLEMSYQIVDAVSYLHSLGIIHTDIKLDNIAVKCADVTTVKWLDVLTGYHDKKILVSTQICILDLGRAVHAIVPTGNHGRVGCLPYRAPEVILGMGWSYGVDAFAIGCTLANIYLGNSLMSMDIDSDQEHLASIDRLVGPFPEEYARRLNEKYPKTFKFDNGASVLFPPEGDVETDASCVEAVTRLTRLQPISASIHHRSLCDLIRDLMCPNPGERLTLDAATRHKYFDGLDALQLG